MQSNHNTVNTGAVPKRPRKAAAWMLAAGSLLAAASFAPANAQVENAVPGAETGYPDWHHGHHPHGGEGHWFAQLNLSDAQKASIKQIMVNARTQTQPLHAQMRANSLKLMQTQPNDQNYAAAVSQVSQANASLHAQLTTQRAETRAAIFNLLTPAQQTQLASLEAQRQAQREASTPPR